MLNPVTPHLVQGRAVEIRKSDGNKPNDSFIVKKNEEKDNESEDRYKKTRKDSRKKKKDRKERKRHSRRSRSRSSRSSSRSSNSSWSFDDKERRSQDKVSNDNLVKNC